MRAESSLCSEVSRAAAEPIAGTAVHATRWLLLEVPGPWPRDVSDAAALPDAARDAAFEWLEAAAPSRLLFVRRPGRAQKKRSAFVIRAEESATKVRRFELRRIDDLAAVDLANGGEAIDAQLVLVCGHGARDRCCALRGTAVFAALDARVPEDALWISSHQGGHRFAGNVLVLPSGIQLGRVDPEDATAVTTRALAGIIELDRYRGRTAFPPHVQAAEHALREALGLERLEALKLASIDGDVVRFRDASGHVHTATAEAVEGPVLPASCGAPPEPQKAFAVRVR